MSIEMTWLGQGGFLFASEDTRLVVDPYFSDALAAQDLPRLCPPPFPVKTLRPDLVVCTHDHCDHLDPETIVLLAQEFPECRFAGPGSVLKHLNALHITGERCLPLTIGQPLLFGPFRLVPTPAIHSDPDAIGLLLETKEYNTYLSGDTEYDDALAAQVLALSTSTIDLALVCINGRWGNMNSEEAARTVKALRPRAALPMHYGLFARNTADPTPFIEEVRKEGVVSTNLAIGTPVCIRTYVEDT